MTTARILLTAWACILLPTVSAWAIGTPAPRTIAIPNEAPQFDGDGSHEVKRPVSRDGQSTGELAVPRITFEPDGEFPQRSTASNRIDPLLGTRHIVSGDDNLGIPPDPPTGKQVNVAEALKGSITDGEQGRTSPGARNPGDGLLPNKSRDDARAGAADEPPWSSTVLFYAIVTTCLCAACMYSFYLAYEYRQRWIEALTMQNHRLSQSFDALAEGLPSDFYLSDTLLNPGVSDPSYGGIRFGELAEHP